MRALFFALIVSTSAMLYADDPTLIQVVGNPRAYPADKTTSVTDMMVKYVSIVDQGAATGLVVVSNRVPVGTTWIHVFAPASSYVSDIFVDPKDLDRLLLEAGAESVEEFGAILVDRSIRLEGVLYREYKSALGFLDPVPFLAFTTTKDTKIILE